MVQVKDLIKALQKMPQNLEVCVEHTELDGFIGINNAIETKDEDENEKICLLTYEY